MLTCAITTARTFKGTRATSKAEPGTMYETTKMWLRMGGRGIDAASNYLNEDEIGKEA